MEIIFESNTDTPTKFTLPNGEEIVNFGHVIIIQGDPFEPIS